MQAGEMVPTLSFVGQSLNQSGLMLIVYNFI
jgi:hypothetical protein